MTATIYYDGDCPFCTRYAALLRLRDSVGTVALVNVRQDATARETLQAAGHNLDQGMVVDLDGRRYEGGDAVHVLSMLSGGSGLLNGLIARLFRSALVATLLYPVLRAGRSLSLFLLGRDRISQDSSNQRAYFRLFSHAWGVLAFMQLMYCFYQAGGMVVFWSTWLLGLLGAWMALRPGSPRIFAALIVAMVVDGVARAPEYSNHAILSNFTLAAIAASAIYTWARGRSWSSFMESFAPVGRCLLATMYVFGVFHKINSGFLDPSVSCATSLWRDMPAPLGLIDGPWLDYLTIYGTLLGETAILLGLAIRRTRHAAIITGMLFHGMLALSGYNFYPTFSTIAIALHLLFLSPAAAARITTSQQWQRFPGGRGVRAGILMAWMLLILALTRLVSLATPVGAVWMLWGARLIYLVAKFGGERDVTEFTHGPPMVSRSWLLNCISLLFLLNCLAPYLGLKTAQSMNMFANLAVEGGYTNHLVLTGKPGPFTYLDDVVRPLGGGPGVIGIAYAGGLHLPYYAILDAIERNRGAKVSFERDGIVYKDQTYASLRSDIDRELHPRWFRAWFHFRPIDMSSPKRCASTQ